MKVSLNKYLKLRKPGQRYFASQNTPPAFLKEYSKLFEESKILEKIIPRKIESGNQLRALYPFLLKNEEEF